MAEAAALLGGLAAEELMFGRADQYEATSDAVVKDLAILSDVVVRYRAARRRAIRAGDARFFADADRRRSGEGFRQAYRRDLGLPREGPHDAETLRLVDEAYALARSLLDPARLALHQVASRLSDGESVTGAEVLDMISAHGAGRLRPSDEEAVEGVAQELDAAEAGLHVLPTGWRLPSWVK